MNFKDMNLKPEIVKALNDINISEPTIIQEQAIPVA